MKVAQISWGYSSAGRAPALQAGCQGFEPPYLHHHDYSPGNRAFSFPGDSPGLEPRESAACARSAGAESPLTSTKRFRRSRAKFRGLFLSPEKSENRFWRKSGANQTVDAINSHAEVPPPLVFLSGAGVAYSIPVIYKSTGGAVICLRDGSCRCCPLFFAFTFVRFSSSQDTQFCVRGKNDQKFSVLEAKAM